MTEKDPEFDRFVDDYDKALEEGLSVSGEDKTYFAQARVDWLAACLDLLKIEPSSILDFGCGTGTATPYLLRLAGASSVIGIDVSAKSLKIAEEIHGSDQILFQEVNAYRPDGKTDLAFCNGVFHHISLDQRGGAIDCIRESLRPGGLFALWENNPWNPGTRYVMSKIPFDRDAITLSPPEAARLVRPVG